MEMSGIGTIVRGTIPETQPYMRHCVSIARTRASHPAHPSSLYVPAWNMVKGDESYYECYRGLEFIREEAQNRGKLHAFKL